MWVSRAAFEALETAHHRETQALREEVAWLRDQLVDTLTSLDEAHEHLRRMDRVERNLPEQPRAPKPPDEPMPEKVQRVVMLFAEGSPRHALVSSIDKARQNGQTWDQVYDAMLGELPEGYAERLEGPKV